MSKYTWKFTMGTAREPTWEVFKYYNNQTLSKTGVLPVADKYLVGYAKRAKDDGWFVRISGLNDNPMSAKLYLGDDEFPPDFMKLMLEMYKNEHAYTLD